MKTKLLAVAVSALVIVGCEEKTKEEPKPTEPTEKDLSLTLNYLENLGDNYTYEGWIIVEGKSPISTGRFDIGTDEQAKAEKSFKVNAGDLDSASYFVLTIEPKKDDEPGASKTHILAGSFSGKTATLSLYDEKAVGITQQEATNAALSSTYFLATPSDGGVDSNEKSGVWFLKNPASPMASLILPDLGEGWKYEGWVVTNNADGNPVPLSTGRFSSAAGADSDNSHSGNVPIPFPGEDFLKDAPEGLTFPLDLTGAKIVISIEPDPDNSLGPFFLKPLVATVYDTTSVHTSHPLGPNLELAQKIPGGKAERP